MKIAIVHDWFDKPGGAEFVIKNLLDIYPEADLFALVDFFSEEHRDKFLQGKHAHVSFIQKLPFARKIFRNYLPFFPIAIEQLDLREYDLIISSSHAVAKGVMTGPEQTHICYIYSPIRYAWDMYGVYFEEHNISAIKAFLLRIIFHYIRLWDVVSATRVDHFVSISSLVARRVQKYYNRTTTVLHPPVDTERFGFCDTKEPFYITASRLVPYKKVKLIVEAFNENGKPLKVIGEGEQLEEIKKIAKENIEILGYCSDAELTTLMQKAKAFVYAAYEDFGIAPVEAMSCGTPIIAYGKGGIRDTVIDGVTGLFFHEYSTQAINEAVRRFEKSTFNAKVISTHAQKFSKERFQKKFKALVETTLSGEATV